MFHVFQGTFSRSWDSQNPCGPSAIALTRTLELPSMFTNYVIDKIFTTRYVGCRRSLFGERDNHFSCSQDSSYPWQLKHWRLSFTSFFSSRPHAPSPTWRAGLITVWDLDDHLRVPCVVAHTFQQVITPTNKSWFPLTLLTSFPWPLRLPLSRSRALV